MLQREARTYRCDDGKCFVLKGEAARPLSYHDEWFCSELARCVGVRCPPAAVIKRSNGEMVFGSRIISDSYHDDWASLLNKRMISRDELLEQYETLYAFDRFVQNTDRHRSNILVTPTDNGAVIWAIDWSRSWSVYGLPPRMVRQAAWRRTEQGLREVEALIGPLRVSSLEAQLKRITDVPTAAIAAILDAQPETWMGASAATLCDWWDSGGAHLRAERVADTFARTRSV